MQNILLTGSTGFIGRNLKELLPPMLCPTHAELDLTDAAKVKDYLFFNKPELIIHAASNDKDICLYDNLRMFHNLAESRIPMITFCTGREIEDRSYKNGEYVFSKYLIKELALTKYNHISVIQIWGCFGRYEKPIRFFTANMERVKRGEPILVQEDRLFSYVYVDDLVRFIGEEIKNDFHIASRIVGYTQSFLSFAQVLKKVTGSPHEIIVESSNFYHSYVGQPNINIKITPLEEALTQLWEYVKKNG